MTLPAFSDVIRRAVTPDLYSGMFPEQLAFCTDPAPLIDAVCSRRAGKTWGLVRKTAKTCESKKKALVAYLTKTRDWARDLVWDPLIEITQQRKTADIKDFNNSRLQAVMRNGSKIRLAGAKDKAAVEVLRGFGYDLFIIDEAGSIDPVIMRYVLKEILPAALGEKRGQLLVVGTPNESCSGYFHDISTQLNSGFSSHHWTQRENIEFPLWAGCDPKDKDRLVDEYLASERKKYKFAETDPEYQREYMGVWARNETLYIFRITEANEMYSPNIQLDKVLAIDLGWHDHTAFELLGYSEDKMYEVESRGEEKQTFDDIMAITNDHVDRHGKDIFKIVVDTAGAGKIVQESMAKELRMRCDIPCVAAQKTDKATYMKFLNSDFKTGHAFVLPGDEGARQELQIFQWDDRHLREKETAEKKDRGDGYIYGYRECHHWMKEFKEVLPEIGTAERYNLDAARQEEEEAEAMVNPSQPWWEKT